MTETKEDYFAKLEKQLGEWKKQIDTLADKAQGMTAAARQAYDKRIEEGRRHLGEARQKLDALRHIGADRWDEGKAVFERFLKEAKGVFEKH